MHLGDTASNADMATALANYNARVARCISTQHTQEMVVAGGAALALAIFPGYWKLLSIPVGIGLYAAMDFGMGPFRSPDCDYGF